MISPDLRQAQASADQISRAMLQLIDSLKHHPEIDLAELAWVRHAFLRSITRLRGVLDNSHTRRA